VSIDRRPFPARTRSPAGPPLLALLATGAAALCAVPLVYLTIRVLSGGPEAIERWLLRERTVELTVTTVALAATVIVGSLLLGVATAWVTTRVRLPAARLWLILAALPLAVPSYVSAFAWVATIPGLSGFWPLAMIMVLACTPYVTLPVAAALRMADQRQSDAARTLGSGPARAFMTVSLPQLWPAAAAGALLVGLYTIADFGAPAMLRVPVLTWAVRASYLVSFDRNAAAALALVLVLLALLLTVGELAARRGVVRRRPAGNVPRARRRTVPAATSVVIMVGLGLVATGSVALPLAALVRRLLLAKGVVAALDWERLTAATVTTLGLGVAGGLAATLVALPLAALAARHPSRLAEALQVLVFVGHGLPGIVVGLALVFTTLALVPIAYQSYAALVFAYVVLFLPKSLAASRGALENVSPTLDLVAQTLGRSRRRAFWDITVRLAWPGIAAGALLVMLTVMKELPATLMLRPTGSTTLATTLWDRTAVARYAAATPYAIALVVLAALPAWLLSDRPQREPAARERVEP
jgi:iron(III) transport system permease protein